MRPSPHRHLGRHRRGQDGDLGAAPQPVEDVHVDEVQHAEGHEQQPEQEGSRGGDNAGVRRRHAALAALLLLLAGCSSEGADDVVVAPPEAGPGAGSTADPATAPPQDGPGTTGGGPSPPSTAPATTNGPAGTIGSGTTRSTPDDRPVVPDDAGPLGSMGPALLSPTLPAVVVEVDATAGEALTSRARQALQDALVTHGGKRTVRSRGASTVPSSDAYSVAELRELAATHRVTASSAEELSVYVLVLEGAFEVDGVTGVAFEASSFALFPDTIRNGLLPAMSYPSFEQSVAVHELGHLFGLVNVTGHGAFHEDPERPGHSVSRRSVMFWAVEDVSIANLFRGGPPTEFDADDRRELDLIRSGG